MQWANPAFCSAKTPEVWRSLPLQRQTDTVIAFIQTLAHGSGLPSRQAQS